jgi:hypothetical protein
MSWITESQAVRASHFSEWCWQNCDTFALSEKGHCYGIFSSLSVMSGATSTRLLGWVGVQFGVQDRFGWMVSNSTRFFA